MFLFLKPKETLAWFFMKPYILTVISSNSRIKTDLGLTFDFTSF